MLALSSCAAGVVSCTLAGGQHETVTKLNLMSSSSCMVALGARCVSWSASGVDPSLSLTAFSGHLAQRRHMSLCKATIFVCTRCFTLIKAIYVVKLWP